MSLCCCLYCRISVSSCPLLSRVVVGEEWVSRGDGRVACAEVRAMPPSRKPLDKSETRHGITKGIRVQRSAPPQGGLSIHTSNTLVLTIYKPCNYITASLFRNAQSMKIYIMKETNKKNRSHYWRYW